MPATKTESSISISMLAPTFTQTTFVDAIKAAMNSAGFGATFDEYTSGTDRYLIYQLVFDANKIYGTVYLVIRVTSALAVTQRLYTGWNKTTRVGDNAGTETSNSGAVFANNSQVDFVGFSKAPEFRLVAVFQANAVVYLGYVRPETKPVWWDENAYSYAFVPNPNSNFVVWYGTAMAPYTGGVGTKDRLQAHLNVAQFALQNPVTSKRDILANVLFYAYSNEGIAGRSSADLVMMSSTNLLRRDVIQVTPGVEEYYLLNAAFGGLGVRII